MDTVTLGYNVTTVEDCEDAWTAGANVTASLEATIIQRGSGSAKFIVDAAASAGAVLGYEDFSSTDLTAKDSLAFWIYSTVALSAGDLDIMLDNTSACVSPLESIDVPATLANTWTRHVVTIATPAGLGAVISVGFKMVVDKAGFTFYVDDVIAFNSKSFNLLWQRGLDDPEDLYDWPGISTPLLDGSLDYKNKRFGRNVTLQLDVISTEADRIWLAKAMSHISNGSIRIIYASDEVEGVKGQSGHSLQWFGDFENAQGALISVREKTPLWSESKVPPSWA